MDRPTPLRYALEHPAVGPVTAIGPRKLGISHPKLDEILHRDFGDCSALAQAVSVFGCTSVDLPLDGRRYVGGLLARQSSGSVPSFSAGKISPNLQAASIQRKAESSFKRLQIDTIDLYQIHWPAWKGGPESASPGIDRRPSEVTREPWKSIGGVFIATT